MLIKRRDIYVIIIALALSLISYFVITGVRLSARAARVCEVYVDGALYKSVPLGEDARVVIEQPNGCVNVIYVTPDGFYMESSTCKNQLCVMQGEVTTANFTRRSLGAHILCLPNRVDARLLTARDGELEGAPDA